MSSKVVLKSLNQQQKDAVIAPLKPVLVVAGAGTGKTTVLIKRFEYLVKEKNIDPEKIILVTFTKKAAQEIKKRIGILFPDQDFLKNVKVSTFHKFCRELLDSEGRNFKVCFESKAIGCVKEAIQRLRLPLKSNSECARLIWKVKWFQNVKDSQATAWDLIKAGREVTPLSDQSIEKKYPFKEFKKIWMEYEKILKENNSLYYDDILFETNALLDNEEKRSKWEQKTEAILFDEFQDIDPIQFQIITKISKDYRNIFCVGDPDQAIYGFRNALPEAFQDFKDHFKDAEIVKLEINYRSTIQILDVANELINKKKNIFSKNLIAGSKNKDGEKVKYFVTKSQNREVEEITNSILNLNSKGKVPFKKIAVLFRNWSFARKLNESLTYKRIPFFSEDLKKIVNKEEMRDTLAYLNLAFENDIFNANKALLRVINKPTRGFGEKYLESLKEEARNLGMPLIKHVVSEEISRKDQRCEDLRSIIMTIRNIAKDKKINLHRKVSAILRETGLINYFNKIDPQRVSNINLFITLIFEDNLTDLEGIREKLRKLTKYSIDRDVVYLTTIHGAKGLEFDYIFVMHMDEGKIPSKFTLNEKDPKELEKKINEERRLAYVAFTRAKKSLFLSSANGEQNRSRFIKDVEGLLLKTIDIFDDEEKDGDIFNETPEDFYLDEENQRNSDLEDDDEE